jgi:glycosyltransferase involved in cell wall biosynthesis
MKQPVILQVLPQLRTGGVERGTIEITGAIAKAGGRALVASAGGAMVPSVAYAGGEHITLPLTRKHPLGLWMNAGKLEKLIREQKVEIVHARSRAPAWSAYWATQRTGTPFVTTFHGVYGLAPKFKKHYNQVMTKGDRVIAVSHFVAKHIEENYAIDPAKIRTIHRGVDTNVFDPARILPQRMVDLASKWRIPDDLPIIMMPGRITRWKGQHIVIEALAKLPHRKFFCLLVGDDMGHPSYRKEIEERSFELGIDGHIRFVGNTPHMSEAYMLANVIVAPSIEPEAFGRVPVEAQAMGRMVIATNHGGACETVVPNETGWLVKPGDSDELAKAIDYALSLPEEEKAYIGANAMEHVRTHFSAQVMCQKTLAVYLELLGDAYV